MEEVEAQLRRLWPEIELEMSSTDQIDPMLVGYFKNGDFKRQDVSPLFASERTKRLVVPMVNTLFAHPEIVRVIIVTEAWAADLPVDERMPKGQQVRDRDDKYDIILFSIFERDKSKDSLWCVPVLEGRKGLGEPMKFDSEHASGNMMR